MAIRNRKGQTLNVDGQTPKRGPGRPRKTETTSKSKKVSAPTKPVIQKATTTNGAFHEVFPYHLQYKEDKITRNCYFQCQSHMDKHIERYKLKKSEITIGATEPRTN